MEARVYFTYTPTFAMHIHRPTDQYFPQQSKKLPLQTLCALSSSQFSSKYIADKGASY